MNYHQAMIRSRNAAYLKRYYTWRVVWLINVPINEPGARAILSAQFLMASGSIDLRLYHQRRFKLRNSRSTMKTKIPLFRPWQGNTGRGLERQQRSVRTDAVEHDRLPALSGHDPAHSCEWPEGWDLPLTRHRLRSCVS